MNALWVVRAGTAHGSENTRPAAAGESMDSTADEPHGGETCNWYEPIFKVEKQTKLLYTC